MDDLISRQAVVDAIKRCESADRYDFNNGMIRLFRALNAIADIPSAQPDVHYRNVGEWDMFDLITSTYYGKMMYSKQDNGIIYSRYSGKYMWMDEAINEFLALIGGELG